VSHPHQTLHTARKTRRCRRAHISTSECSCAPANHGALKRKVVEGPFKVGPGCGVGGMGALGDAAEGGGLGAVGRCASHATQDTRRPTTSVPPRTAAIMTSLRACDRNGRTSPSSMEYRQSRIGCQSYAFEAGRNATAPGWMRGIARVPGPEDPGKWHGRPSRIVGQPRQPAQS
jgi:hypothetical protein